MKLSEIIVTYGDQEVKWIETIEAIKQYQEVKIAFDVLPANKLPKKVCKDHTRWKECLDLASTVSYSGMAELISDAELLYKSYG